MWVRILLSVRFISIVVPCPCLAVNERNSPLDYSVQSADAPVDAEVYEDDFESLPNSEANDQSKRSSNVR